MQSLSSTQERMSGSTNYSAPVTFTVRNSTVHVIYEVRVIWFIDMTPGQVLLVMILHIWQGVAGAVLVPHIMGVCYASASSHAYRLPNRTERALLF